MLSRGRGKTVKEFPHFSNLPFYWCHRPTMWWFWDSVDVLLTTTTPDFSSFHYGGRDKSGQDMLYLGCAEKLRPNDTELQQWCRASDQIELCGFARDSIFSFFCSKHSVHSVFFPKKAGETVGGVQGKTELHVKFAELLSTKFLFISRKRIRLPKMSNFTTNSPHSLIPEPILWLAHAKQQQKHFQMFSQGLQTLGFSVVQGGWAVANACLQKHCF